MSARDYSSALFCKAGQAPAFLPARLRLPSRMTRYSNCISLEEIESMGYIGPVVVPEYNHDTEKVEWSFDSNSYLVVAKTTDELAKEKDTEIREILQAEFDKSNKFRNSGVYSPQYITVWTTYLNKISALLASDVLLDNDDIPVLDPLPTIIFAADLEAAQEAAIAEDAIGDDQPNGYDWKYLYEHVGVEAWKPPGYPALQPFNYEVPLDWVASGTAQ